MVKCLLFLALTGCMSQREVCERKGGKFHQGPCHDDTTTTYQYVDYGNGTIIMMPMTSTNTVCDSWCEMPPRAR